MTSYYTELDDALGADEEAEISMREWERKQRRERKEFAAAVAIEVDRQLRRHGILKKAQPVKTKTATSKPRGATVEVTCKCGEKFHARVADRRRGWGRFCSKSCKAFYSK